MTKIFIIKSAKLGFPGGTRTAKNIPVKASSKEAAINKLKRIGYFQIRGIREHQRRMETSMNKGHSYQWRRRMTFTSIDQRHKHRIDERHMRALPGGRDKHTHRLLKT